jgi:hypothetical protein
VELDGRQREERTDSDSNFTGRPRACVAPRGDHCLDLEAYIDEPGKRGRRHDQRGTATTAPIPMSHFRARRNAPPPD